MDLLPSPIRDTGIRCNVRQVDLEGTEAILEALSNFWGTGRETNLLPVIVSNFWLRQTVEMLLYSFVSALESGKYGSMQYID
jgi:hypothetical protein